MCKLHTSLSPIISPERGKYEYYYNGGMHYVGRNSSSSYGLSSEVRNEMKDLIERYDTPLPKIDQQAKELENKVNAHLKKMGFVW
jgi:hypothetical protein